MTNCKEGTYVKRHFQESKVAFLGEELAVYPGSNRCLGKLQNIFRGKLENIDEQSLFYPVPNICKILPNNEVNTSCENQPPRFAKNSQLLWMALLLSPSGILITKSGFDVKIIIIPQ